MHGWAGLGRRRNLSRPARLLACYRTVLAPHEGEKGRIDTESQQERMVSVRILAVGLRDNKVAIPAGIIRQALCIFLSTAFYAGNGDPLGGICNG